MLRRRRFQKGSLQLRKRGKCKRWVVLYYDDTGKRAFHILGSGKMPKPDAEEKRAEFMRGINGVEDTGAGSRPALLREFIKQTFLPFQRGKWKKSTAGTASQRIKTHITKTIGDQPVSGFTPSSLQTFLETKAAAGLSFSVVDHLRWDLTSIFRMAIAEKLITTDPTTGLYTPKTAKAQKPARVLTAPQVMMALFAMEPRERVILELAIKGGFRPGEILGLQRKHIAPDARSIQVAQRVYRGGMDEPKTRGSVRKAAVPPDAAALLLDWLTMTVPSNPEAFVFANERGRPLWRDTLLADHIRPKLKPIGLDWLDFQVMRRTHGSLGHKIDPKVMADQRGHGIGVAVDVYTKSSMADLAAAAKQLEESLLVV